MSDTTGEHPKGSPFIPGNGPECLVCPVCLMLYGLRQARPEVIEHLSKATMEILLAVKAVVDQAAEKAEPLDSLHRIPVR
ncbi:MAG: hypothetical protein ABR548_07805 [Actinomycetota bacterium]|nr:hypothetical protein [Actinomycetota bacterium]